MHLTLLVLLAALADYDAVKPDLAAFDTQLFPAWAGTAWDFYGTTEVPRQGQIACGYYVSTLMRDAGFKVERIKLAKEYSGRIVRTLAEDDETLRFRDVPLAALLQQVRVRLGEGLFVVGMDFHVAFLRIDSRGEQLCHAAFFEPKSAICEDAATSPGFASSYHVVGKLFADAQLRGWLAGQSFPVRR